MSLLEREIGYSDNLKLSTKSNGLRRKSNQRRKKNSLKEWQREREKEEGGNQKGIHHADEDELMYKRESYELYIDFKEMAIV